MSPTLTAPRRVVVLVLLPVLAGGCAGAGDRPPVSAVSSPAAGFPTATFAALREQPVPADVAAELQTALGTHDVTGGGGMSATVMSTEGTWSGTTGTADGARLLTIADQFAIASITKTVVAAQVMLMAEAGELRLDDPVAEHLPAGLRLDTNGATIRHLLGHRSGMPDYYDLLQDSQEEEPKRTWTTAEVLARLPRDRAPAGEDFAYAETNYLLLQLVIEHRRGRPLARVLREGALAVDGLERLVHQPDERPTEPMAVPGGGARTVLRARGGFLPSLASATAFHASGAIASDAPSLARWWRALCAGEIVSRASLDEMSAYLPAQHLGGYGLGAYDPANGYARGFGHTGQLPGYVSWAACLPQEEAVVVVLSNHEVGDGHFAFSHGLARPLVEALRRR